MSAASRLAGVVTTRQSDPGFVDAVGGRHPVLRAFEGNQRDSERGLLGKLATALAAHPGHPGAGSGVVWPKISACLGDTLGGEPRHGFERDRFPNYSSGKGLLGPVTPRRTDENTTQTMNATYKVARPPRPPDDATSGRLPPCFLGAGNSPSA